MKGLINGNKWYLTNVKKSIQIILKNLTEDKKNMRNQLKFLKNKQKLMKAKSLIFSQRCNLKLIKLWEILQ